VGRPQKVDVFTLQDRRRHGKAKPWLVRWRVEGRQRARSFRTRAEADRYRSLLTHAVTTGERFELRTGEPLAWTAAATAAEVSVFEWARRWLAEQWPEWQPRTRRSAVEALSRLVPLTVVDTAGPVPRSLRAFLTEALEPGADLDDGDPNLRWLVRHGLSLADLDKATLAAVDLRLGQADSGARLSASTATRRRTVARACIRRAVQLDVLPADPWPPAAGGRAARKINRKRRGVDVHALPDPPTMVGILEAMASHQPGSLTYQQMTAVVYYAGLRPLPVVFAISVANFGANR
jgi:hypothetical protein